MTASHAPASPAPRTPSLAAFLRRADPDRYLCSLFAPAAHRETLFTLYAFNHELARACEISREPGLAFIRLQWWREVVEGAARLHEVASPLTRALAAGRLRPARLLPMIEAREREAEADFTTLADWTDWLRHGAGALAAAASSVLGAPAALEPRMVALGAGIGAAGQLRNIAALARQGRCLLPRDLLAAHGLTGAHIIAAPDAPAAPLRAALARHAAALLGPPLSLDRPFIAAALPAILARRDIARPDAPPLRGIGARAAVLRAALTCRC